MIKIAVLGAGHLGRIHLKLLKEIPQFIISGFYEPDDEKAWKAEKDFNVPKLHSLEEAIEKSDAIDIVTPTLLHFECAEAALRNCRHIFIEKPITNTLEEARKLIQLSTEANMKVQIGHVERFNPAFLAASQFCSNPMFIEAHRLAQFNPRGTDVPVVLDLMIHDIDIVLSVVKSNIKNISASGVSVISDTPDITNARIEFDNGCVANLTASRISLKTMRKARFFQKDAYISVDFLEKKTEIIRLKDAGDNPDPFALIINPGEGKRPKQICFESPEIKDSNAIKAELEGFANSILNNQTPLVTINDGYQALDVAHKILDKTKITSTIL